MIATSAELWSPTGVAVDDAGHIYIADDFNSRIRSVGLGTTYGNLQGVSSWYQIYGPTSGSAAPYGNGDTGSSCASGQYGLESYTTGVSSPSLRGGSL